MKLLVRVAWAVPRALTLASRQRGRLDEAELASRLEEAGCGGGEGDGLHGGPLGELRIFERVGEARAEQKVYATWQEEEDALAAAAAAGKELGTYDDRWQEGGFDEAEAMDFAGDYEDFGMPDS